MIDSLTARVYTLCKMERIFEKYEMCLSAFLLNIAFMCDESHRIHFKMYDAVD